MVICTVEVNEKSPQTIVIGRRGTYNTQEIVFDIGYLIDAYGAGTAVLAIKRSQDSSAYPTVVTQEDTTLTWMVSETDTYYVGAGECQLMWYVDGGLAKTIIYPLVVMRDILSTSEEAPDAYQEWVDNLTALGAETLENAQNAAQSASNAESAKDDSVTAKEASEEAAKKAEEASGHYPTIVNSYWYVWNTETKSYQNTGVKAEGTDGKDGKDGIDGDDGYSPVVTITDITDGHRVTITDKTHPSGQTFDVMDGVVQSVNGKSAAAITLDSGDIGFDDSETYAAGSIGAEVSNQKNAINTKAPVIINTASGDIVTFADGADGMPIKHLIANIEAVQSGTGDPSPSNVRPITGWTGLDGTRTGKNLADINNWIVEQGVPLTISDGVITLSRSAYQESRNKYVLPSKATFVLSFHVKTIALENTSTTFAVYADGIKTLPSSGASSIGNIPLESVGTEKDVVVQLINKSEISFGGWAYSGTVEITNLQLELGSTASDYEEYQGQTISVSWQSEAGTVYGGTLDVVSGVLTVDRAIVVYDGSSDENWSLQSINSYDIANFSITQYHYPASNYQSLCNMLLPQTSGISATSTEGYFVHQNGNTIYIRINSARASTVAELKTWLANNNIQIVYTITTSQTYQLTPQEVDTLLGQNNVWVDCGSVRVDYPVDTGIVVEDLSNAIEQKQNATSYVTLSGTIVTQTGVDNTMYLCGELAELTFTAPATGITAIRFTSGTTATVVTLNGITMPDDWTGAEASTTYEINVLNGYGAWQSWT